MSDILHHRPFMRLYARLACSSLDHRSESALVALTMLHLLRLFLIVCIDYCIHGAGANRTTPSLAGLAEMLAVTAGCRRRINIIIP